MGKLVSFLAAVESLGKTHEERGRALGRSDRQIIKWLRHGETPELLHSIARYPQLARALLEDAEAGRWNGTHDDKPAA